MIHDNTALYSTIAGINGVWLSILFSFGSVVLIYIIEKNQDFIKLQREEKIKIYDSFNIINNNIQFTFFPRTIPIDSANKRLSGTIQEINSKYKGNNSAILNIGMRIGEIEKVVQSIVSCYPHIGDIGNKFLMSDRLLFGDKEYEKWVKDYDSRIKNNSVHASLDIILDYLSFIRETPSIDSNQKKSLVEIESVISNLKSMNESIQKIKVLKRDYAHIVIILNQTRPFVYILLGSLVVGVLFPLFMLSPIRLNFFSENIVMWSIFIGLLVCYAYAFIKIKKTVYSLLDAFVPKESGP